MGNSGLVNCTVKSPNHSGKRTHAIDRITPHCVVGQLAAENIGYCFPKGRNASCNYAIGRDGRICLVVDEWNRSWCTSSNSNDQRAVTIECASDKTHPYAMNSTVFNKLVDLCTDICKRNNKTVLLWFGDKGKTLNYNPKPNEMVLTVHRWFSATACPGDWLMGRMGELASRVTAKLKPAGSSKPAGVTALYRVQVGAYKDKKNAEAQAEKLKKAGFDCFIKYVNGLYKVQVGAYKEKKNAEAQAKKLESKGFKNYITK